MTNAEKFKQVFGIPFAIWMSHSNSCMEWLKKEYDAPESEKCKCQEPPLGKQPDYIYLSFEQLCKMVGKPVFVVCPEHKNKYIIGPDRLPEVKRWEIIEGVKRNGNGDYVQFRGDEDWYELKGLYIYVNQEGSEIDENLMRTYRND